MCQLSQYSSNILYISWVVILIILILHFLLRGWKLCLLDAAGFSKLNKNKLPEFWCSCSLMQFLDAVVSNSQSNYLFTMKVSSCPYSWFTHIWICFAIVKTVWMLFNIYSDGIWHFFTVEGFVIYHHYSLLEDHCNLYLGVFVFIVTRTYNWWVQITSHHQVCISYSLEVKNLPFQLKVFLWNT